MLDRRQRWLLDLLRYELGRHGRAEFASDQPALTVKHPPHSGRYHLDWRKAEAAGAHHLGEDHPLAASCIAVAVERQLRPGDLQLALPAGANAARWSGLAGQSGVWAVAMASAEGLGGDDALFTVCLTDQGQPLDGEVAERMWQLPAQGHAPAAAANPLLQGQLDAGLQVSAAHHRERLRQQRAELLDQEADKLGRWAEDEKLALKLHLDRLDQEIGEVQRQVRQVQRLDEKLELRRRERDLDRQRTELRRSLFEAQDRVDAERGRLLDALEAVVSGEVRVQTVMTGRWRVG
jgi:adenine-specific DNA-methyltransferase